MAKAYECDRCGILYTDKSKCEHTVKLSFPDHSRDVAVNGVYITANGHPPITFDLCPDCMGEFCEWYNKAKKGDNTDSATEFLKTILPDAFKKGVNQ